MWLKRLKDVFYHDYENLPLYQVATHNLCCDASERARLKWVLGKVKELEAHKRRDIRVDLIGTVYSRDTITFWWEDHPETSWLLYTASNACTLLEQLSEQKYGEVVGRYTYV